MAGSVSRVHQDHVCLLQSFQLPEQSLLCHLAELGGSGGRPQPGRYPDAARSRLEYVAEFSSSGQYIGDRPLLLQSAQRSNVCVIRIGVDQYDPATAVCASDGQIDSQRRDSHAPFAAPEHNQRRARRRSAAGIAQGVLHELS
jgi:hypothetical protein